MLGIKTISKQSWRISYTALVSELTKQAKSKLSETLTPIFQFLTRDLLNSI